MRFIAVTALAAVGLAACISVTTTESFAENPDSTSYSLTGWDEIGVSSGIEVTYVQAPGYSIEVEAPDGHLDRFEASVKDGKLRLSRENNGWGWSGRQPRFIVTVMGPRLEGLDVSSGSSFSTNSVASPDFEAEVSSGASVSIAWLETEDLEIELSSGASMSLGGTCTRIEAEASSGASLKAGKMSCAFGDIEASSGASVSIDLSDSVIAGASSGASVNVSGGPTSTKVSKSISGSVNITR